MKWGYGLAVVLIGGVVLTSLSFAKTVVEPQSSVALAQENVNTIAEEITVMIDGPGDDEQGKGSGVIIGRQGNIYYVLTNKHIIKKNGDYQVQTVNGNRYVVNYRQIQTLPGLDLAVLQFSSNQNYRVATLGDSDQVSRPQKIYVFGYRTPGVIFTSRSRVYAEGMILDIVPPFSEGYALVYILNIIQPGMSGGPVLDERGQLIGINGLAERDERTGRADFIAGIPSNTFRTRLVDIFPLLTQASLTPTSIPTPASKRAPSQFYCGKTKDGKPATIVNHSTRGSLTVIIWSSLQLSDSGQSQEQRCKAVSSRFQIFNQSGQLNYIITGKINGISVVCAVPDKNSLCSYNNILTSFQSETEANEFVDKLNIFNSTPSYSSGGSHSSGGSQCLSKGSCPPPAPFDSRNPGGGL